MRGKRIVLIIAVFVTLFLVGFLVFGKRGANIETVKTATATTGDIRSYLSTNAVIQSKNSKSYMGAPQLTVKSVNVKTGDQVLKGRVMLTYDLTDLNTSLQQARIQYSNALLQRADLINQKRQLDEAIKKVDAQIKQLEASPNPADIAQLSALKQKRDAMQPISDEKIKLMENSVSLAKLALDTASSRYDKYSSGIIAEFNGVVTSVNAVEGAAANPALPAVTVQQLDNLKAVMSLGKYDAQKVKAGQQAVLKNSGKTYKGVVSSIDPSAVKSTSISGQTTSLNANIDIIDPDPDLKVDFDVNVDILLGSANNVLKIPIECVKYDKSGNAFVFKAVDGVARQTAVTLGIQSDTEAQIIKGVTSGDNIILNPGISISDGTPVKINGGSGK